MVDLKNPVLDFSAMDRCSRCNAQAVTLAQHEKFGEFLFCMHHRRHHFDHLIDTGWEVIDDMARFEELGVCV